jgi:hypothetical protein
MTFQIKEDEMAGACSTRVRRHEWIKNFSRKVPSGRYFEDLAVDGKIFIKLNHKKRELKDLGWIQLTQCNEQWHFFIAVSTGRLQKSGNFLAS